MRLHDTPPPTSLLAPPRFGFGSPHLKKESLPTLAPESLRTKSRRASHVVPVLSVPTTTGD